MGEGRLTVFNFHTAYCFSKTVQPAVVKRPYKSDLEKIGNTLR
jgi:hypothetical protein